MSKMLKVVGASWLQTKISSYILGFLGVMAILALFVGQIERIQEDGTYAATVFYSEKTGYRIEFWGQSNELADIKRGVARAYFRKDIDTVGWSTLEVETDGSYPDEIQAYAAGIVEGALTWSLIHTHLENTIRAICYNQTVQKQCDRLRDALEQSANTWKTYASENEQDPFWHHVSLYYTQVRGVKTGWEHGVQRSMNEFETDISDLYWLNAVAEVAELQQKMNLSIEDSMLDRLPGLSSALLRIVNETTQEGDVRPKLFVAHNTVGSYSSMMRILKRYKLNYRQTAAEDSPPAPTFSIDFSSYPGSVTSQDEYYLLQGENHKIIVTGTPIRNYNNKLWKDVNITEQVPIGPRVTAANHLSVNVSAWVHNLARSNSGTGCKQWLVVDCLALDKAHENTAPVSDVEEVVTDYQFSGRNKDTRHTAVHRGSAGGGGGGGGGGGAVWVVEQAPARTHSADVTRTALRQGYWYSIGVPFIKDIAEHTNTTQMEASYGSIFSESNSPRALIIKESYKNATSVDSVIQLMRQLKFTALSSNKTDLCPDDQTDCIFSEEGYLSVLGVRGDLVHKYKRPYGVIDTKVISGNSEKLEFTALSSPPYTAERANDTQAQLNKGNVASTYTDQFDDVPAIDGLGIRNLVKHQQEEAEQDALEIWNSQRVQPFIWSQSPFKDKTPKSFPDRWDFLPFSPKWAW